MRTYEDIAKEMLELRDVVRKLTEERDRLRAGYVERLEQVSKAQGECDQLRATVAKLTEERDGLLTARNRLENLTLQLASERNALRQQVGQLEARLLLHNDKVKKAAEILRLPLSDAEAFVNSSQEVTLHQIRLANETNDTLRTQLAERDGQIAVLREQLDWWTKHQSMFRELPNDTRAVLANTARAAADHDERVRAEERERCVSVVQQTCKHAHDGAICACADAIAALSTARKEK